MLFVYAVLVWLSISILLAAWMLYQHVLAKRHKPPPVDRNGIRAVYLCAQGVMMELIYLLQVSQPLSLS